MQQGQFQHVLNFKIYDSSYTNSGVNTQFMYLTYSKIML